MPLKPHPTDPDKLVYVPREHDLPTKRKPLTDEQRQDLMNKAWHEWLSKKDDGRLFAWDFSFVVEAAHGIKEKNT
jgi:hypothetical protein